MKKTIVKVLGGKTDLLPDIIGRMPIDYGATHEPFAGGLALTLELQPRQAYAIDINRELVNAHIVVRDGVDELIVELRKLDFIHSSLATLEEKARHYYIVREQFNAVSFSKKSPAERAATYIFLNKSGFNGLYRENLSGGFNVPHGKQMKPSILQESKLRQASAAMRSVVIEAGDFARVLEVASPGDFVLLDGPYHGTFTSYNAKKFDWNEQLRLFQVCRLLSDMKVHWMMTNSDDPAIRSLYAAYHIESIIAPRRVSGKASGRGHVSELIVTSYPRAFYKAGMA